MVTVFHVQSPVVFYVSVVNKIIIVKIILILLNKLELLGVVLAKPVRGEMRRPRIVTFLK